MEQQPRRHKRQRLQEEHDAQEMDDFKMQSHLIPQMILGVVSDYSTLHEPLALEVKSTISKYDTAREILDIADSYTSLPNSEILAILTESIKHAGNGVASTFFELHSENAIWGEKDYTIDRDELAVELMSFSLTKVKYNNCKFHLTTNGTEAKKRWMKLINGNKGTEMGRALIVEELVRNHGFQKFLNDKSRWCQYLEDILLERNYVMGTVVKQLESNTSLPAMMKLFFLQILGSERYITIVNAWRLYSSDILVKRAGLFVESDNHLTFSVAHFELNPFEAQVLAECSKSKTVSWISPSISISEYETSYGGSVGDWLDSHNGPKKFGLRTRTEPNNMQTEYHSSTSMYGGFLSGTEVHLQNDIVRINHLSENDKIIGANGQIGLVSSEKVEIIFENEALLFGFNDDPVFFLPSHPFWTQHGWRAIDPYVAKNENEWLEVGQLKEGDFVRRLYGFSEKQNKFNYEWVRIKSLHFDKFPKGTKVYGIHTREGSRTYHANRYLVLENYPEITMDRLTHGMNYLSYANQEEVYNQLEALKPSLATILGPGAAKAIAGLGHAHLARILNPKDPKKPACVSLREVTIPDMKINTDYKSSEDYVLPKKLTLLRGHLFLDGEFVNSSDIIGENKVAWTRSMPNGKWEHGAIHLNPDRQTGHGSVFYTEERDDVGSVASASFIASANINTYTCCISKNPVSKETEKVTEWSAFGKLLMGIDCSGDTCKRIGKIQICPTMDEPDSLNNHVNFSVDKNGLLNVTVNVPTDYCSDLGYVKLTGTFSWDFSSFSGTAIQYDALKPGFEGDSYAWKGTIAKDIEMVRMNGYATKVGIKNRVHEQTDYQLTSPLKVSPGLVAPMALHATTYTDSMLTLENLFTLAPPDPTSAHDLTFSFIQQCMKYKMDDSDRLNLLGVVKPTDMPYNLLTVSNKYSDFFADRFSNAYLMNGLAHSEHFKDKITQDERNKLLYYWAGNDPACLSQDKDYNKVNDDVSREAYIQLLPELQKYVDSDGPCWAKKLYCHLMQKEVLTGLAVQADFAQSTALIQKQSMVLFCLDPNTDYASQFYHKVLMVRLGDNSSYFQGNPECQKEMHDFVVDYMHQLFAKILSGGDGISSEISDELNKQMQAASKELHIELNEDAINDAKRITAAMDAFISDTITLFNMKTGSSFDKLIDSMNSWMTSHPRLVSVGKLLSGVFNMAFWSMSLIYTIQEFMQWKTLSLEEKVSLITNTISFTFMSISKIPDFLDSVVASCKNGKATFVTIKNKLTVQEDPAIYDGMSENIEMTNFAKTDGEVSSTEAISNAAAVAAEDEAATLTNWQKFFKISGTIGKLTGVIALAASVVTLGFQIANDFKSGAPVAQKVLDIMNEVCTGVSLIAATAGLFVESMVIPVVGIVCAIVGIIIAIVSMFIKREPPKPKPSPADIYVSGPGKEFVSDLKSPTQEWLDDYEKGHKNDKN